MYEHMYMHQGTYVILLKIFGVNFFHYMNTNRLQNLQYLLFSTSKNIAI